MTDPVDSRAIAARVDQRMKDLGLDAKALAKRLNVTSKTIYAYRDGDGFTFRNLAKLATALECDYIWLLTGVVVPNQEAVKAVFMLADEVASEYAKETGVPLSQEARADLAVDFLSDAASGIPVRHLIRDGERLQRLLRHMRRPDPSRGERSAA